MRFHVDIDTDGPVTASAVRDALEHAIDRQRLNVGLSGADDEGTVTGFTVTQAEDAAAGKPLRKRKPVRIRCTDPNKNVSYVMKDERRGWSCTLSDGTAAAMSYAGIRDDEVGAKIALDDAVGAGGALAVMRRLGRKSFIYEAV